MTNWIKCSERMPDDRQGCIIWTNSVEFGEDGIVVANYSSSSELFCFAHDCNQIWVQLGVEDVTHWMPLPEPPSEEE